MNFNENYINMVERVGKFNRQTYKNDVYLSNQKPKHAENGILVIARAILYHPVLQYIGHSFFLFYECQQHPFEFRGKLRKK